MAKQRPKIPKDTEDELLYRSRHACNICRDPSKHVEIHHIDGNPNNNKLANLIVLCRDCHSKVTGKALGKSYTKGELVRYRAEWEAIVRVYPLQLPSTQSYRVEPEMANRLNKITENTIESKRVETSKSDLKNKSQKISSAKRMKIIKQNEKRLLSIYEFLDKMRIDLVKSGNPQQALEVCDQIIMSYPEHSAYATRSKARILFGLKKYRMAKLVLLKLIKSKPRDTKTLGLLSDICFSTEGYKKAYAYAQKILRIEPNNADSLNTIADCLSHFGKLKESIDYHERVLKINPKDTSVITHTASIYCQLNEHEKALAMFRRAESMKPNDSKLLWGLGQELEHNGNTDEALLYLDKSIECDPKIAEPFYIKAMIFSKQEKHDEALKLLLKANELDPDNSMHLYAIASEFIVLGKFDDALEYIEKCIKIDATDIDYWSLKAKALTELGKHAEALTCENHLLHLRPNDPITLYNKGITLTDLGQVEEALKIYDFLLEKAPNDVQVLVNKGAILFNNYDRVDDALVFFNRALSIDSDHEVALCNKGNVLAKKGDFNAAIEHYRRSTGKAFYHAYRPMAFIFMNQKRYSEAIESFKKFLQKSPDDGRAWYTLACAFSLCGQKEDAFVALNKAIDIDPSFKDRIKTDKEFDLLKDDARYAKLVTND